MNTSSEDNDKSESKGKAGSKTQGVGRLAIDAVLAITDIVESQHSRIDPFTGVFSESQQEQTSGIAGLVYRNIRSITGIVGKSIDRPLAVLSKALNTKPYSSANHALRSALNGVLGDYLIDRKNSLAIQMQFRLDGQTLDTKQLAGIIERCNGKILVMVHGLCMNDLQWEYNDHDHGAKLADELDMAVVYLHYNTGRHISDNGGDFAELLESLVALSTKRLQLNIVAHSMGGLVSRSAHAMANKRGHVWHKQLHTMIFLGTPHQGAALERTGNWLDLILGIHSYTAALSRLIKVRSAGITDLRFGNLQESDWLNKDRFEFTEDQRLPLPLPTGVRCFAVATSAGNTVNYLLGDGLVSIESALGKHKKPEMDLNIPAHRQWTGTNINHIQLLGDQQIYFKLKSWLETSEEGKTS